MYNVLFFFVLETTNWSLEMIQDHPYVDTVILSDEEKLKKYLDETYPGDEDLTIFAVLRNGEIRKVDFEYKVVLRGYISAD